MLYVLLQMPSKLDPADEIQLHNSVICEEKQFSVWLMLWLMTGMESTALTNAHNGTFPCVCAFKGRGYAYMELRAFERQLMTSENGS